LDVIFTIVSRNYAAQAATLMQTLAAQEPKARRIVVATDGPIPALAGLAEVVDAREFGAPFAAMSVYYEALELNTAVKPYVFQTLLAAPGATSVTYLDPDIFVFRPLDRVRQGLAEAQLALTPHLTRPLLGEASPNDLAILRSGSFNLGFCAARAEPKVIDLMSWWADRCEFDCRVDLQNGLFTDQRWMDLSPGFVDSLAVLRHPGLNLAYWNLEGRKLARGKNGWTVDGEPLDFFHFSGFDPQRPKTLSKHQNRVKVAAGSPLAELLADYAAALLRNGHDEAAKIPYAHNRFASGRAVTPLMRRRALRAARAGERFATGLSDKTEAWFDAPDPGAAEPGLADITRLMEQVWRENPGADPFDWKSGESRLAFHQWIADNAPALGVDAASLAAARRLARQAGRSPRDAAPEIWREPRKSAAANGADPFDWLREPVKGLPRACRAALVARGDLRQRFAEDPDGLLAWCLGPEAAAGRFAADLLPAPVLERLAKEPTLLFKAAEFAERNAAPTDLRRRLSPGFGVGARARWPEQLTAPLREPHVAPAQGHPAPYIRLFLEIWESRPELQRLYPLSGAVSRFRYLRWLLAGGLADYGIELEALPARVRRHPLMRLAELSVRRYRKPLPAAAPAPSIERLLVMETTEDETLPAGALAYDAASGRFVGAGGASPAPGRVGLVSFRTAPALVPADAIALHARGVRWARAEGVWTADEIAALPADGPVRAFVDDVRALDG
jgi:hypothetical protein